jgi:hypothetical protein
MYGESQRSLPSPSCNCLENVIQKLEILSSRTVSQLCRKVTATRSSLSEGQRRIGEGETFLTILSRRIALQITLKQTCLLIPCSESQLKTVLVKKKAQVPLGPVQYRHDGRCRRRIRLLSVADIKRLRAYFVRPKKVA